LRLVSDDTLPAGAQPRREPRTTSPALLFCHTPRPAVS